MLGTKSVNLPSNATSKTIQLMTKMRYLIIWWIFANFKNSANVIVTNIAITAPNPALIPNKLKISDYQSFDKKINKNLYNFINIKNSVNNKKSYGGTNILEVKKMITLAKKEIKKWKLLKLAMSSTK